MLKDYQSSALQSLNHSDVRRDNMTAAEHVVLYCLGSILA